MLERDSKTSLNNMRIAKNTMLLYVRTLLIMAVTLYTSRVVLEALGVEDYGIYNVVGGVIAMFAFIKSSMTSATQRYITFALGKGDIEEQKLVFSTSLQIHIIISLLIILLGETIGLWFLLEKLVIPENRMTAAIWVYQCSIISSAITIISVPYNAEIVAHEKMSAFAYISLFEVVLKLLIVYLLYVSPFDKLLSYGILHLIILVVIRQIYMQYCRSHFEEAKYHHNLNISLLKEMAKFAGWSFWGNLASILYTHGLNLMLNVFFGPVVNASRGIAVQVQAAVHQFVGNFQTALNPQITKTYAQGALSQMHLLMYRSAKFSFYLIFFLTLPILIETNFVLKIWLKTVPENAVIFTQLILINSLIYTIANPCVIANQATGKVKVYQMVVGGLLLMIIPTSYVVLKMGAPAYSVFLVHFGIECIAQFFRMYILKDIIHLPILQYFKNIYSYVILIILSSIVLPLYIHSLFEEGWMRFIAVGLSCVISVLVSVCYLGLKKHEREFILGKVTSLIKYRIK